MFDNLSTTSSFSFSCTTGGVRKLRIRPKSCLLSSAGVHELQPHLDSADIFRDHCSGGSSLHQASSAFGKTAGDMGLSQVCIPTFCQSLNDGTGGFTSGKPSSSSITPSCMLTMSNSTA